MPCNQVVLNNIEIHVADLDLLTRALETLAGLGISRLSNVRPRQLAETIIREGFISLPAGQEYLADKIKQEYSRQTIQAAARKCGLRGWKITQKSPQKLVATRRV